MTAVAKITDHQSDAVARLSQKHVDKTNLPGLIRALAKPAVAVEDALIQLLTERAIDTAIGTQLDIIGSLVGIDRADIDSTLSDTDYRRYVRAKIWTQRSAGIAFDILRVMRLLFIETAAVIVLEFGYPAGLSVTITGISISADVSTIAAQFLRDSTAAGVRALLETSADISAEMFTFARFSPLSGAHATPIGAITVDDASKFAAIGSIIVNEGLADEETLAYTGHTATVFTLTGVTAFAHVDNSSVTQDASPGKGFGDELAPLLGGKFASAKEGL